MNSKLVFIVPFLITCLCEAQPVIVDFLPRSAPQGSTVVIAGYGFSGTLSKVSFNGIPAIVNSGSATSLSVTVPAQVSLNYITIKAGGLSTTSLVPFDVTNTACAKYTFANPSAYSTGAIPDPYGLTVVDFNNDGYLDMVSANSSTGSVSAFTGTGTGTFGNRVIYSAGTNPVHISSGDFNGDGFTDLVTANSGGNNISVLPGSASGVFGSQILYNTGSSPKAVCVGDFNADGYQDVATANSSNNSVTVLLSTGTGLSAAVVYSVGIQPSFITVGDFNGDGKQDLATTNYNSDNISVLTGTGIGTFGTQTTFSLGIGSPSALIVGDFNGDSKQDLAIANYINNMVTVLIGTGTGTFSTQLTYPVGTSPNSIIVGDFNGDGKQDLATANYNSGNLSVLQGSGTGTFAPYTTLPGVGYPSCLAIGDFNGDSKHDLAVANSTANLVSIFLGQCALPTVIVQQPSSATVCSGIVKAFTTSATGTGTITYAWSNGATGNTMSTSIAGNYMVTASGLGGIAISTIAGLTINTIPAINFNYGTGNYCQNSGTITVSGTYPGGGYFTAAPGGLSLNTISGNVVTGFSSTQAYIVTYGLSVVGCGLVTSTTGFTVTGVPSGGAVSGPSMTCYGNSVGLTLNSATAGTSIQWKESLNNGTSYSSIGTGLLTVTSSILSVSGSYLALVTNGICAIVTSAGHTVGVTTRNDAGTISGATNVCSGVTTTLSTSGQSGSVYQWQTYTTGSFNDIGPAVSSTYTTPSLASGIYLYRLKITDLYGCTPAYSNVLTVTAAACMIAANYTVTGAAVQQCFSSNSFQFNDISMGSVTGWSWNFGSGASIASASTKGPHTITYSTTGSKTIFLSVVGTGGITSTFSGIVQVDALSAVSTILSSLPSYCYNTQANLTITSAVGNPQWQASSDGTNWSDIPGANGTVYVTAGPAPNSYFRTKVTNGTCPAAFNTPVLVSAAGQSMGGSAVTVANSVCQNTSASFGVTGYKGIIQWQTSPDGSTGWANVSGGSGATSANYTTAGLANLQDYYFRAMVTNGTGCTPAFSSVIDIATQACSTVISVSSATIGGTGGVNEISTENGTLQMQSNVYPTNANTNTLVGWSISPITIATIDGNGLITAISNGIATVTGTFGALIVTSVITVSGQYVCLTPVINTQPIGQAVCQGSNASLSVQVGGSRLNYLWSNGAISSGITTQQAGSYSVKAYNTCGTVTSALVNVVVSPSISVTALSNSPLTAENDLNLGASAIAGASYTWSGPNGFTSTLTSSVVTSVDTLQRGIYAVTAVSGACSATSSVTVVVNRLIIPKFFVTGQDIVPVNTLITYNQVSVPGFTYVWSYTGNGVLYSDANQTSFEIFYKDVATQGSIISRVYDKNGNLVSEEIIPITLSNASIASSLAALQCSAILNDCKNYNINSFKLGRIDNENTGCSRLGIGDFTASGQIDTLLMGSVVEASITVNLQQKVTSYYGIWIDYANDGNFDEPEDFITSAFEDGYALTIKNIFIRTNNSFEGPRRLRVRMRTSGAFTAGESCPIDEEAGETEDYLVFVKGIERVQIQVAGVLTPNNDGKNDLFVIRGINKNASNKLVILDRWGVVKYEMENYDSKWDGKDKNGNQLEGTFFYFFTNGDQKVNGFVEILKD